MEQKKQNLIAPTVLPNSKPSRKRRERSMTTINMQWLGERVRKARRIKQLIEAGEYNVDSKLVAKAMLGS